MLRCPSFVPPGTSGRIGKGVTIGGYWVGRFCAKVLLDEYPGTRFRGHMSDGKIGLILGKATAELLDVPTGWKDAWLTVVKDWYFPEGGGLYTGFVEPPILVEFRDQQSMMRDCDEALTITGGCVTLCNNIASALEGWLWVISDTVVDTTDGAIETGPEDRWWVVIWVVPHVFNKSTVPAASGLLVVGEVTALVGDAVGTTLSGVGVLGLGLNGLPGIIDSFRLANGVPWSDIWRKNPWFSSPDFGLGVCCTVAGGVFGGVAMVTGLCDKGAATWLSSTFVVALMGGVGCVDGSFSSCSDDSKPSDSLSIVYCPFWITVSLIVLPWVLSCVSHSEDSSEGVCLGDG